MRSPSFFKITVGYPSTEYSCINGLFPSEQSTSVHVKLNNPTFFLLKLFLKLSHSGLARLQWGHQSAKKNMSSASPSRLLSFAKSAVPKFSTVL